MEPVIFLWCKTNIFCFVFLLLSFTFFRYWLCMFYNGNLACFIDCTCFVSSRPLESLQNACRLSPPDQNYRDSTFGLSFVRYRRNKVLLIKFRILCFCLVVFRLSDFCILVLGYCGGSGVFDSEENLACADENGVNDCVITLWAWVISKQSFTEYSKMYNLVDKMVKI